MIKTLPILRIDNQIDQINFHYWYQNWDLKKKKRKTRKAQNGLAGGMQTTLQDDLAQLEGTRKELLK